MCFLHGFGQNNPPPYKDPNGPDTRAQISTLVGGIANGVTGDGSGIQWMPLSEWYLNWRWNEQWLPHAAWYLVAITALER
jgi:hypothetical protein